MLESGPYPLVITAEGTSLITVANSTNRGESPTAQGGGNFFSEKTLDLSKKELLNLSLVDRRIVSQSFFRDFLIFIGDLTQTQVSTSRNLWHRGENAASFFLPIVILPSWVVDLMKIRLGK